VHARITQISGKVKQYFFFLLLENTICRISQSLLHSFTK